MVKVQVAVGDTNNLISVLCYVYNIFDGVDPIKRIIIAVDVFDISQLVVACEENTVVGRLRGSRGR